GRRGRRRRRCGGGAAQPPPGDGNCHCCQGRRGQVGVKRLLACLLLAGAGMIGLAGPAFAHNVLVGSDPKDGTSVEAGPSTVSLTFDLPIQQGDFDVITVTGPNNTRWEAGPAKVDSNVISAPVRPLGAAGEYTVG